MSSAADLSDSAQPAESVRPHFVLRALILTAGSAVFGLAVSSAPVAAWLQQTLSAGLPRLDTGEVGYLAFIARSLLMGLGLILLLLIVIRLERPHSLRALFRIGPVDWPGDGWTQAA